MLLAVQSLDQGVIVLPLGESFGIREDSEIELGRCHGRGAVSQARFVVILFSYFIIRWRLRIQNSENVPFWVSLSRNSFFLHLI